MDKIVLIDFDSILYKNIESLDEYCDRVDEIISQVVVDTKSSHYRVFLESKGNTTFRKILNPSYKANRVNKELPLNFKEIKEYIIQTYNPYLSVGVETDDSIISTIKYLQSEYPLSEVVIAVNDKDYHTFPVTSYDLYHARFGEIKNITKEQANFNFHKQLLMGDASDNVKGVKGIGDKGASKVLENSKFLLLSVAREYKKVYKGKWKEVLKVNHLMLKLREDCKPCKEFDKVEFN
jgi:DNA polymerase-1